MLQWLHGKQQQQKDLFSIGAKQLTNKEKWRRTNKYTIRPIKASRYIYRLPIRQANKHDSKMKKITKFFNRKNTTFQIALLQKKNAILKHNINNKSTGIKKFINQNIR